MDKGKLFPVTLLAGLLILLLIATSHAGSIYVRCHFVEYAPNQIDTSWVPCVQVRDSDLCRLIESIRTVMHETGIETSIIQMDGPDTILATILLDSDIYHLLDDELDSAVYEITGRYRAYYR